MIYDNLQNPGLAEKKLKELGFKNILGSFEKLEDDYQGYSIDSATFSDFHKDSFTILDVRRMN